MTKFNKSLFSKPKSKYLASRISIKSPTAFHRSIRTLSRGGLKLTEKRALTLAQTRAKLQLRRKSLSQGERKQFRAIATMKIPKVGRRR